MTKNVQGDIDRFVEYFQSRLSEVKALTAEHAELYRRVLYVGIIDTLAGAAMPKRPSQHERFVYFLKRFCCWSDGERVSLPHLVQLLRKNPDPAFEKLRTWALPKYKEMPAFSGELTPISSDPLCDEVRKMWPGGKEHRTPLEGIDLESLQHFHLLYAYRNSLVHELRMPGYGMEFGDRDEPYYHRMSTADGDDFAATAELVYPQNFMHKLCSAGLASVQQYFSANELNPYDSYVFGSYWLRELNR